MTIHIVVPTPMLSSKGKGVGSVSSAGAIAQQQRMENNLICFSPASGPCISIPPPMVLSQETEPSLPESHGDNGDRRVPSVVLREQSLASSCLDCSARKTKTPALWSMQIRTLPTKTE